MSTRIDTRSVSEIIGWHQEHVWQYNACIYCGAYEHSIREEKTCHGGDRHPTVDDLLAWMGVWVEIGWEPDPGEDCPAIVHVFLRSGHITTLRAATLIGALERAVPVAAAEKATP